MEQYGTIESSKKFKKKSEISVRFHIRMWLIVDNEVKKRRR